MSKLTGNLDGIADDIRKTLTVRDTAREKVLPLSREVIHNCSLTIRAVHRHEFDQAAELLKKAADLLLQAKQAMVGCEELVGAGYIRDAEKEYAEASTLIAMVGALSLPSPVDLRIDAAAYLNGLGEAVGELRRYLLDSIRGGDLSRGEELLGAMDDIYNVLITMDFPDAVTGGLRRTTDLVRGILEKTRSDFTLILRQQSLEKRLEKFEEESKFVNPN